MLDVYNAIAHAVRAGASEGGVAELNERLRAVFEEFRLDRVDAGVVGVLPVLRPGPAAAAVEGLLRRRGAASHPPR